MKKSFFLVFYIVFALFTIFTLFSVKISPEIHWVFALLPLTIPVLLVLNLILLIWIPKNNILLLLLCIAVHVLGYKFILRTFQIGLFNGDPKGKTELLSYNVRVFNSYSHLNKSGNNSKKIIDFALNHPADIKCFQEFYHSEDTKEYQLLNSFKKTHPYRYFDPSVVVKGSHYFGLAIFSKYPIIRKGEVHFPRETFNQAIFADIVIGKDTLRVYNMHLQSMSIDEKKLPKAASDEENKQRLKLIIQKLRWGAAFRAGQVDVLVDHICNSPYKVILAGDLNDTPYSYSYERLKENLNNAFQEEGSGFGFTYNGKLFFLRIDNIFSDDRITIESFKTRDDVTHSDHFPLEVAFSFE